MMKKNQINMLAIILCTKNGENFIIEQLNSIKLQAYKNFDIYIKDNYSSDNTLILINKFIEENPELNIFFLKGDYEYFANSYILGLMDIPKKYNFYAFCDQDDIWEHYHLQRSVEYLENISDIPAVYCSRTKLINEYGDYIGMSLYFPKNPCFKNALVQSIAGANTMVFNKKSFDLFKQVDCDKKVISHDWLLYILVTAGNGSFLYDLNPSVRYRQHQNNLIGSNLGLFNALKRLKLMFMGRFREYNKSNIVHLKSFNSITADNKEVLSNFKQSIYSKKPLRIFYLLKSKVFRQTLLGHIALMFNIFFDGPKK
jgi:glycosyltransferase involved in cell wall biosynthesis